MCECGCSELSNPVRIIKIDSNKYIAIERSPGCEYCGYGPNVNLFFYDKIGFEDMLSESGLEPEKIKFDEYGGDVIGISSLNAVVLRKELQKYYGKEKFMFVEGDDEDIEYDEDIDGPLMDESLFDIISTAVYAPDEEI